MSASPAGLPSPAGLSAAGTPNSNGGQTGQPKYIRRPPRADPLRQHKRPVQRPTQMPKSSAPKPNGPQPLGKPKPTSLKPGNQLSIPRYQGPGPSLPNAATHTAQTGFSETPAGDYHDFKLFTTKRALREGLRYHVARFQSKKEVDPSSQDQFIRPVSLHRRDPRQPAVGKGFKDEEMAEPVDDKDREKQEIAKAEKEAQRAKDLAQIAPSGNNAAALAAKKTQSFKNEKTTQIHRLDKTEEQKKESDLRYEEALPWHLEDAENKQTWVGNYEAALSDINVIFLVEGDKFKMVPVEKWYKFTAKNQFKAMTIEEAEEKMKQKSKASRWVMHAQEQQKTAQERQATQQSLGKLYTVKGESNTYKNSTKRETQDADDLDFEDDLFADDDEQVTVEPENDEDTKDAAEKIKREQLGANLFGEGDENEVEKEAAKDEREEEMKKKLGKKTKKALKKREKNYLYDSDSSHPYSTSSDDDTSDEEKQADDDRKKDEEAKLKAKNAVKPPSGASSKGTNTPSGRPKHSDLLKRHSSNHLKRPGSPSLSASETSGNESSRKKHKNKHGSSSSQPTGSSTPVPSRPMSPAPSSSAPMQGVHSRKSSIIKLNINGSKVNQIQSLPPNPSSMSDGEATAGEMSDSPKKKTIKLRAGSPAGSRAGSPVGSPPLQRNGTPVPRTQSSQRPDAQAGALKTVVSRPSPQKTVGTGPITGPITGAEIAASIPADGITIGDILKLFAGRIGNNTNKDARANFIRMVSQNSDYNAQTKLLKPKRV